MVLTPLVIRVDFAKIYGKKLKGVCKGDTLRFLNTFIKKCDIRMELLNPTIIKQFKKENLSYIKYGLDKEQELKQFIINRYDSQLKPTKHYAKFDFESNRMRIEVKNRTCNHFTFDTTMVGYNKILEGKKDDRDCIFLFSFADGSLFEWKLDKTREYTPTKRTDFKQTSYTPFSPTKANYYVPMCECSMLMPPIIKEIPKETGCLIKIKT